MEPAGEGPAGYRWSCPICGASRVVLSEIGPRNAIEGLRAHLEIYDGDGHGPGEAFPADVDRGRLEEFVVPLRDDGSASDGRTDPTPPQDSARRE